jgi:hypothetical protein
VRRVRVPWKSAIQGSVCRTRSNRLECSPVETASSSRIDGPPIPPSSLWPEKSPYRPADERGIRPVNGPSRITLFYWVIVNIIHVAGKILCVANGRFPIPPLPNSLSVFHLP